MRVAMEGQEKLCESEKTYLPMMYARGRVVRRNSSFAVLSPMPPVPPTKTTTNSPRALPWALDSRMVSMRTISRFAPVPRSARAERKTAVQKKRLPSS